MKQLILRIDAAFLFLAGIFGVSSDLLSYYAGRGSFGEIFYQNPLVISAVEAHLFAVMTAAFIWRFSKNETSDSGNWMGIFAHLICGVSNIVWFEIFRLANAVEQGFVVTIIHFVFVILNASSIYVNLKTGKKMI